MFSFTGPLSKTRNNNQYIIVVVDYFTKWVEAEPTENVTSQDVIKFLINVFARHGVPQIITTCNEYWNIRVLKSVTQ